MSTRTYYSSFYPSETAAGSKGSAAFLSNTNTFIIYLYKRSPTVLLDADKPNGDVIYTFNTGNIDITAVTNGWSSTVPTGTDALYLVGATATGTDPEDTILTNEWTTPALLGSAGTDGLSNATIFLFQRNNTGIAPAVPSTATTYTFATGILSGTYTGWSQTAPDSAGGKYLFITTATAISATATDTIDDTEWATVRILAQDGADGYTAYLTNESHTVPATFAGVVSAYTGAVGNFVILKNGTDISSNFTLSVVSNPQTLTVAFTNTGVGGVDRTYTISGGLDSGEDSASLTIRASGSGTYAGVTIDKVFSLGKSKAGSNGEPAKLLTISSDKQAFTLNGSGVYTPSGQFITLTAKKQNTTQTVNWTTSPAITIKDTNGNATTTGDVVRIYATDTGVNTAIEITATLTDGVVLTDKVTLVKIQDGAPGSNGLNTVILYLYQRLNSVPALPSSTATYDFSTKALTGFNNGWSVTIPAGTLPLYVTAATASSTGTTDTIGSGEWASPVVLVKDGDTGPSGTNNATLSIYQRTETNIAPALPSAVGTTYTFSTGVLTGLDNGWTFKSLPTTGGSYRWMSTATALSTDATDNIASTEWSAAALLSEDGIDGLSGLLTNEAFTTSSLNDGTGYSLTGSGGTFKVYSGTTDVTTSSTFTGTATQNGLTLTIVAGTGVYTLSGASWTTNNEIFTLQATYNGTIISKIYSISKVKNGAPGTPSVTGVLTAESVVLYTYADGSVTSYVPASGTFKMYNGTTDVTTSSSFAVSGTPVNGTATIGASTGVYNLTSMSSDVATVTLTGTYAGTTITKVFTVTKSKAGYEIVTTLPTGNLFAGRVVFLTTDSKLYRYITGTGWSKAADGADITAGTITANAIGAGEITAAKIASNTITANKLVMNSRPIYTPYLQFTAGPNNTNVLYWNSALLKYINDSNAFVDGTINDGNYAWTAGVGNRYIYWIPGNPVLQNSGDLSTAAASTNVVLGWYNGSDQWYPLYGETVISGNFIQTGTIKAANVAAGAITADKISVTNLQAVSATIGTLRTATSGARTEIKDNLIQVYDASNVLRVRMGIW